MTTNDLYYGRSLYIGEVKKRLSREYCFGQGQSTGKLTSIDGHDTLDGRRAGNQMRRVAIRGNRAAEERVMQKGRIGPCGLLLWN
jgi:hypothetical protein